VRCSSFQTEIERTSSGPRRYPESATGISGETPGAPYVQEMKALSNKAGTLSPKMTVCRNV
jgi:hypothetical protein